MRIGVLRLSPTAGSPVGVGWGGTSVTAVLEKVTNEQPLLKAPYDREETAAKATLAIPGMETVVAGGGGTGRALSEGLLAIYSLPCRTGKS